MSRTLAVIVMAAGRGTRTRIGVPKALLPICGRTLLDCALDAVADLAPARTVLVLHHEKASIEATLTGREGLTILDQGEPRGTGHAVSVAMGVLEDFAGDILVVNADVPLITADTLAALRDARGERAASILTAIPVEPSGLGRILRDKEGRLLGIREERDCTAEEREIAEINAGFYCFDAARLREVVRGLDDQNAQAELYITDATRLLLAAGREVASLRIEDADEVQGVNTLAELTLARIYMQERILLEHLERGVLIEDLATTFIDHAVEIGAGTRILPCTVIRSGVRIGVNCEIGPFSHLRPGTVIEEKAEVGNFVEVKKSVLGSGSKAKHLTYLGDATIGEDVNIGAGTITANYDGVQKNRTVIGDGAFIGSGTVLVAPSLVGSGAMTGAGAVVTGNQEIGDGEVWVGVPAHALRKKAGGEKP